MSKMHRTSLAAVCALLGLGAGCGDATRSDTQTASDDLSSTEASLAAAEESRDAAREAARACFAAFEACVAADGADVEACRATLAECLPDEAPLPPECGEGGGRGDGPGREPPGDGSNQDDEGEAGDGDEDGDGRGGWGGRDCPEDEGDEPADDGDEPADDGEEPADDGEEPADGGELDVAQRRFGGFGGDGPMCERPGLPGGGLAECRQAAQDVIDAGGDRDAARAAFEECAEAAFGDFIDGLCDRAEELCSGNDAPAERCEHLAEACD